MKKSALLLLAALFLPVVCWGADKNGNFGSSLPAELKYCNNYIAALDACMGGHCYKQNIFNAWLNGYITAYNTYVNDTFNIIGKRDPVSIAQVLQSSLRGSPHDRKADRSWLR